MSGKARRPRLKDKYARDLEQFIEDYVATTGDHNWTTIKIAHWAIENGKWQERATTAARRLAKELSRAAQKVHIFDDKGNPVRKYHNYRLGHDQPSLWADVKEITPEGMKSSQKMRRDMLAAGCIQLHRDLTYWNEKYNPGDPILFNPDFTDDIAEKSEPSEYVDAPPDERDGGDTRPEA